MTWGGSPHRGACRGSPGLVVAPEGRGSPTGTIPAAPSPACSDPCPVEENPYEPLDPPIAVPSRKHLPDPPGEPTPVGMRPCSPNRGPAAPSGPAVTPSPSPAHPCCSQERLVLVGAVALGVSVLLNVLLLALGSRRSEYRGGHGSSSTLGLLGAALRLLGDPPSTVTLCPPPVAALTVALDEAETVKQPPNVGACPCRVPPPHFLGVTVSPGPISPPSPSPQPPRPSCCTTKRTTSAWKRAGGS